MGLGAAAAGTPSFELRGLAISSYSIAPSGVAVGTAAFNQAASTVEPVALTSSNPGVASVPPSVPVIPPNDRVTFPVRGVSAGCATIIVAHGGRSKERRMVIHPANSAAGFSLAVPDQILQAKKQVHGWVTTGSSSSGVIAFSSSNRRVVSVQANVQALGGTTSFRILPLQSGCAEISATLRGQTVRKTVQVVETGS